MADHCKANCIYLLLLFFTSTIGKLDSRKNYIPINLDNPAICNPSTDKVQVIDDLRNRGKRDLAILIEPSHVFDTWYVKYNKHCKFRVKATKGDALFAVVQSMSLRRNGTECLDYIMFTSEFGGPPKRYCGKIDFTNGLKHYIPYEEPNTDNQNGLDFIPAMVEEFSAQGKITTEIFISKQPLLPGEKLDLVITYTPCRDYKITEMIGEGFIRIYNTEHVIDTCINLKYICDHYKNCHSRYCYDEKNCTNIMNRIESDGTGTKVTISAVTTIFLCLIIFTLCLWICRKHKKLCWSPDCAGPSNTVSGSTSGLPMERGEQGAPNPPYVPTAPMLEVAVPSSLHDKDLPPSYDSLFPTQSHAVNT
ncbi:uncharacterized protein LOC100677875 [Nasonia vitripennis]|uniref:CUB domain-containing protein n=1 Tax=Nasonia vitripennis TaxID=7425 RepID=A0A7M7GDY8_NASVI|nr:uncharacterized protein LOC100677875 [Nasonia vitripennis]